MMNVAMTIKESSKILQDVLKVFSMFKTRIWYDKNDLPDSLGINSIKCNIVSSYEYDNKR